jgi:hypothetical protein
MNFYEVITYLTGKGSKKQAELLGGHADDVKSELFRLMLSPSVLFYIKKVPDTTICCPVGGTTIRTDAKLLAQLYALLRDDVRGDQLKNRIQDIWNQSDYDRAKTLEWIIDGKNPAKIGASIVNKVWPGLIYKQEYMGAVPGTDEALDRLPWSDGVHLQEKIDGMTFLVEYSNGEPVDIRTRQGQSIGKYFPEFLSSCPSYFWEKGNGVFYFNGIVHHEALVRDPEQGGYLDRKTGNGLINQQVKNAKVGGTVDNCIHTVILDMYIKGWSQEKRYKELWHFCSNRSVRVTQFLVHAEDQAREIAQDFIRNGGEGAICKTRDGKFKNGKPWYCVKIKNEFAVELEIIDTKPHSKRPDELGAVLCASSDRLLQTWVNLRCDADRLRTPYEVTGEIVQVKAESVITSKSKSTASLYLPRMDGSEWSEYHRPDKNRADSYNDIKSQYKASKGI